MHFGPVGGLSGAVPSAMHESTPKFAHPADCRSSGWKSHNRPKSPNIAERPSIPFPTHCRQLVESPLRSSAVPNKQTPFEETPLAHSINCHTKNAYESGQLLNHFFHPHPQSVPKCAPVECPEVALAAIAAVLRMRNSSNSIQI